MADINEACVFGIDIEINDGYPYLKELSTDFMTEEEEGVSLYPYNYKTPFTINPRINDGYPYLKELSTDFMTKEEEGVSLYPYNYKTPFTINPRINDGYPYLKELSTNFLEFGNDDKRTYKAYLGDIPIVKMYYGDEEVKKIF